MRYTFLQRSWRGTLRDAAFPGLYLNNIRADLAVGMPVT